MTVREAGSDGVVGVERIGVVFLFLGVRLLVNRDNMFM